MHNLPILIVEDDLHLREALYDIVTLNGWSVIAVSDGIEAIGYLSNNAVAMVISDVSMPNMDGMALLEHLKQRQPALPVLLMTAHADIPCAVTAIHQGACDYIAKPFDTQTLIERIEQYALKPANNADGIIAQDFAMLEVLQLAAKVARTKATVLLTGESGTGKECIAHYIHSQSERAHHPFIAINCAAIPEHLLESVLFGHEKGAFTGATHQQMGKFEQAQQGTLLLDEISEMPLALQSKLLRVLQEREIERIGSQRTIKLDVRIIATSNRDMQADIQHNRFREDLYYRLAVFPIRLPSLRERNHDILTLAQHFLHRFSQENNHRDLNFSPIAEQAIRAWHWPGNVRELENTIHRAVIMAHGHLVEPYDLGLPIASPQPTSDKPHTHAPISIHNPMSDTLATILMPSSPAGSLDNLERQHIIATLQRVGGSRKQAIAELGISERTLRYKLALYRQQGFLTE